MTLALLTVLVGLTTGLAVLALDAAASAVAGLVWQLPPWVPGVVVAGGLLLTTIIVRALGGRQTATTEVYIQEFHREAPDIALKHVPGRFLASFTTLGSGAPHGMEGPAVYIGAAIAAACHRRFRIDSATYHALLVAGAAAGISAVFKSPVAGAIFAMEVPYRGRMACERVLPALLGSAVGYLTKVAVHGATPELQLPGVAFGVRGLLGALALGVLVGAAARGMIWLVHQGEHAQERWPAWPRALLGGVSLFGLYLLGRAVTGEPVALTAGKLVIAWAIQPEVGIGALAVAAVLRVVGPAVTLASGGVGGLFIPLLAAGAVIGRMFAELVGGVDLTLHSLLGAACMLGAGYGVPFTAVVFVAEYTGQTSIIVPGMLAMVATRVVSGSDSVSPNQIP